MRKQQKQTNQTRRNKQSKNGIKPQMISGGNAAVLQIKQKPRRALKVGKRMGWKECLRYLVFFAMFYLFSMAKSQNGLAPFNVGLLAALIFCKENVLLLAPLYVLAQFAASPSLNTFLVALLPPLIMGMATALHNFFKKPLKMVAVNIYAFLSQLPILILSSKTAAQIVSAVVTLAVSQVFTYCCVIIGYAVLIRGLKYKFTADESASACIVGAALGLGLFRLSIKVYKPFWTIAGFLTILFVYCFEAKHTYILTFVLGFGAAFAERSMGVAAGLLLCAMGASIFAKSNIYFSAATAALCFLLSATFFKAFGVFDYISVISYAAGLIVFLLIPRKKREKILFAASGLRQQAAVRTLINRNRAEVCGKLKEISGVFNDMQRLLGGGSGIAINSADNQQAMAEELTLSICADCAGRSQCFSSLGGDTSKVFLQVAQAACQRGKATLIDIPTFLSSRCRKINAIIDRTNQMAEAYRANQKKLTQADIARQMMSAQMGGVANMLNTLAMEVKKKVTFDGERERKIIEELCYHNIVAKEALVTCRADGEIEVMLTLRQKDCAKRALVGVVNGVMKAKFALIEAKELVGSEGYAIARLATKTKYSVVYGTAGLVKNGSAASGDTTSVRRIGEDKLLIAICDGMGSGKQAEKNSTAAIAMLENMYSAGFGNDMALDLVNRLLSLKSQDDFSALDMCIIDLRSGGADFIKQGAAEGILMRENGAEIIESNALPLGILEEATPKIERKILCNGDTVLLYSDGIAEALGAEAICRYVESNKIVNPQMLCDNIMLMATEGGRVRQDDCTVLAARIYLS